MPDEFKSRKCDKAGCDKEALRTDPRSIWVFAGWPGGCPEWSVLASYCCRLHATESGT